jgi:hypothetical protein
MTTITYPEIYTKCLDIAYREADDRIAGEILDEAIITAASRLYARIAGENPTPHDLPSRRPN